MKKLVAGISVAGAAALFSLGTATAAQAYPDNNPSGTEVSNNGVTSNSNSGTASSLPNTGGPNEPLLFGGAALVVAGAASIVVSRRRQTS